MPKAVPWSYLLVSVPSVSSGRIAYEVFDLLTSLCLLHRDDLNQGSLWPRVPELSTCPRSPVGSHAIFFPRLLPRFGGVSSGNFLKRVRQLFLKLGKSLSVFILLLHSFDISNKYRILS